MANVTAAELLRQFEGFRPTAYYDKNAWRIGYGSDTMTDADGNIVRVTKDSTTTREDAERDLARRIPEFQKNGIIPYVGKANWDRLPEATKAAITSTAYNYGSLSNLTSLTKAIKNGDSDAMAAALKKYAAHNDGENAKRRVAEANVVLGNPIPKVGMASDGTVGLQNLHDRIDAARGYGEIAPTPANISPALQAARTRLATARQQMKDTTAAGMTPADKLQLGMSAGASRLSDPLKAGSAGFNATPRVPGNYDFTQNVNPTAAEIAASKANTPGMDVSPVQSRAIILDEGLGALGNPRSFSPGTLNPGSKTALDPTGNGATLADLNAMKQGGMPPLPRPRPETPTTTTAAPAKTPTATPKMVKLASGKMAPVGATNVSGDSVWTVVDNGDGTGKMVKANAGILKEINADTAAGGVVRQKVGEGITAGKDAVINASKPVIDTVAKTTGDLLGQAGNMLGGLFGGGGGATLGKPDTGIGIKLSLPMDQPKAATSIIPASKPIAAGATLAAPGAGLSAAQRNAMTSLAGTGMANVIAPVPESMPAGLRTAALPKANPITVSKPTPAVQTQPKLYQSGGYVYAANPSGGYTKVGKVGQGAYSNVSTTVKSSTAVSTPTKSSSSTSSGNIPKGYIDAGNGKIISPETGGIYYTRNL